MGNAGLSPPRLASNGSIPLRSTKIAVNPFTSVRQLNVKTAMTFSERR
nr:MAG TPA: hypothetical protein [Caudoviricetes sp.]